VIGPAYQDIANKYPINKITIDTLTEKVIKGGAGNWGQIPMQAHANISKEDARQMVKYILAFKNN
jgi:cytochrome c